MLVKLNVKYIFIHFYYKRNRIRIFFFKKKERKKYIEIINNIQLIIIFVDKYIYIFFN